MNRNNNKALSISFPGAKGIAVSGDIHGNFNQLVFKLCIQYQMKDTLLIVAGDCGLGFEKKESYEQMVKRNAKRMNEANNWIVFVRGNHDNPAYFDDSTFRYKRFTAIPDYAVLQACNHTILCVGGAISVDRYNRINEHKKRFAKIKEKNNSINKLCRNVYWSDENPIFDEEKMNAIHSKFSVDIVITHTAPSFCKPYSKENLATWALNDPSLEKDINAERVVMDQLHKQLVADHQPVTRWCYGHFHQSWHSEIDGILYQMLDVMEFYPIL